jgi:Xaa-Pro dipeptidase
VIELFKRQDEVFHTALDALRPGRSFQEVIDAVEKLDAATPGYSMKLTFHGRGLGDDWPLIVDNVPRGTTGDLSRLAIEPNTAFVVKPTVRPAGTSYRGERITWSDTVVVTDTSARRLGTRPVQALSVEC